MIVYSNAMVMIQGLTPESLLKNPVGNDGSIK